MPPGFSDLELAPLLSGLIGDRRSGWGPAIGLYGFGAAAHLLAQVLRWQGRAVFAFGGAGSGRRW